MHSAKLRLRKPYLSYNFRPSLVFTRIWPNGAADFSKVFFVSKSVMFIILYPALIYVAIMFHHSIKKLIFSQKNNEVKYLSSRRILKDEVEWTLHDPVWNKKNWKTGRLASLRRELNSYFKNNVKQNKITPACFHSSSLLSNTLSRDPASSLFRWRSVCHVLVACISSTESHHLLEINQF